MKKNFLSIIILSAALNISLPAQENNFFDRFENTSENITGALRSVVNWYDVPIGAAYLYRNYINKQFAISPSSFERNFSQTNGINGRESFGSIDKNIFPRTVFYSRFFITASLNIFTDAEITQEDYKRIFLFEKSIIYTYTITEIVKNLTQRERPDGSDNKSFFSGHASTTFAASTFLFLELNDLYNEWDLTKDNPFLKTTFNAVSFSALYGWAGYVGYSRIRDKKHYVSDVVTGAAVGTLISMFVYNNCCGSNDGFLRHLNFFTGEKSLGMSLNVKF
ncbi:MAG: phosphatase PAP2 family protein [Ignavibacteriales bacterium]|nr:phosphatase PAP2 family protein [Ignavibacteriales bacterium]